MDEEPQKCPHTLTPLISASGRSLLDITQKLVETSTRKRSTLEVNRMSFYRHPNEDCKIRGEDVYLACVQGKILSSVRKHTHGNDKTKQNKKLETTVTKILTVTILRGGTGAFFLFFFFCLFSTFQGVRGYSSMVTLLPSHAHCPRLAGPPGRCRHHRQCWGALERDGVCPQHTEHMQ